MHAPACQRLRPTPTPPAKKDPRAVVDDAVICLRRWRAVTILGGIGLLAAMVPAIRSWDGFVLSNACWIGGHLLAATGALAIAEVQVRRARRRLRHLPHPEAIALLRPLASDPRPEARRIVRPLLQRLHPQGFEASPAVLPEGSGSEASPGG